MKSTDVLFSVPLLMAEKGANDQRSATLSNKREKAAITVKGPTLTLSALISIIDHYLAANPRNAPSLPWRQLRVYVFTRQDDR